MNIEHELEDLHAIFNQITPFCKADSNPEVAKKIAHFEQKFVLLKMLAKQQNEMFEGFLGVMKKTKHNVATENLEGKEEWKQKTHPLNNCKNIDEVFEISKHKNEEEQTE